MAHHHLIRSSSFGSFALVWEETGRRARVVRVMLPRGRAAIEPRVIRAFADSRRGRTPVMEALAKRIQRFLGGAPLVFDLDLVALDCCSPFQQAVLRAEHRIPRGRVSTYGLLARVLGRRGGARAVGRALATNPFPIIIPCHRAVRSDGSLGGYQGGVRMKRALLALEGVCIRGGRVVAPRFHYASRIPQIDLPF